MTFTDIIVILVIAGLVGLALGKIIRDKKRGTPCTGCTSCPVAGSCESMKK
ncbi:MAG: FeoB-associated Cys-rich membrane protein [Spirochaetales bacterium]|nr:FeoB-associated Cys-rich membrane protein [Spirochaetales bacterium]